MRAATAPRPASELRTLVVDGTSGSMTIMPSRALTSLFEAGDLLVVNDAATVPASFAARTAHDEPLELRLVGQIDDRRWLAALFGVPGGRVDEVAARLPSALAGIACVAGAWAVARMIGFPGTLAAISAGLLATSFRFVFSARRAQLDVLLAAFELAAIAIFLLLETRRGGCQARQV